MSDERTGGQPGDQAPAESAGLPTRQTRTVGVWRWWLRIVATFAIVDAVAVDVMQLAPLVAVFVAGMVFGVLIDRFIFLPIAIFLARVDGSLRRR